MKIVGTNIKAMQTYTITKKDTPVSGEIVLAPNKSVSKRRLFIQAIKNSKAIPREVSEKEKGELFVKELNKAELETQTAQALRALRFLRAFLSYFGGEWIITGAKEMRDTPVTQVIGYLQKHGQNIRFEEREGFPPLKLIGKSLQGDILGVDASISSQYISASLHVSPDLSHDQILDLKDWVVNSPYINQTLRWLTYLGVNAGWDKDEMLIEHSVQEDTDATLEGDWMVAAYWYPMLAFQKNSQLYIKGLSADSIQPQAYVKELFNSLGVTTKIADDGITVSGTGKPVKSLKVNLSNNPDLILSTLITCVGLKIPCRIVGTESLRDKGVDRIMVVQSQLIKLGVTLKIEKRKGVETLVFDGKANIEKNSTIEFDTFGDHRVLMALVSIAALGVPITVNHPRVVSRSYANFWNDIERLGFEVVQSQK